MDTQAAQRWSRSILLVEDDEDFRVGLAALLSSEGYLVTTAANGLEALEYLRRGPKPSLILLDLMMPVMSGWAFREKMLQESALASIPVILLSAAIGDSESASLNAAACLHKPFELPQLLEMIEGTLLDRCAACSMRVAEGRKTVTVHGAVAAVLCSECGSFDDELSRGLEEALGSVRRSYGRLRASS